MVDACGPAAAESAEPASGASALATPVPVITAAPTPRVTASIPIRPMCAAALFGQLTRTFSCLWLTTDRRAWQTRNTCGPATGIPNSTHIGTMISRGGTKARACSLAAPERRQRCDRHRSSRSDSAKYVNGIRLHSGNFLITERGIPAEWTLRPGQPAASSTPTCWHGAPATPWRPPAIRRSTPPRAVSPRANRSVPSR